MAERNILHPPFLRVDGARYSQPCPAETIAVFSYAVFLVAFGDESWGVIHLVKSRLWVVLINVEIHAVSQRVVTAPLNVIACAW